MIFIPILWLPDGKSWLIWKDPDAGKDWGQEEKGTTEDEMAGWHHRFNGHGFGWTPGFGDGQGGLACCGSWGHKETELTDWLMVVISDFKILFLTLCCTALNWRPQQVSIMIRYCLLTTEQQFLPRFLNQKKHSLDSIKLSYWIHSSKLLYENGTRILGLIF